MYAPVSSVRSVRLLSLLSLAGAALLVSCGKDSTGVELGGVASVVVSPAADTVYIGSSTTLTATPEDADGNPLSGREVFWHSEHSDVAVVSADGAVTGVVPGKVRIAASVEGVAGYSEITVLPKPPASIELSSSTLSLLVGQESRLQATVRDADGGVLGGAPVDWKSSNTSVATVDGDGLVHGVGSGTATITASSGSVSDQATVTVSPVPANAVVVSPGSATLFVGETTTLKATVTDANGDPLSGRPISWSTSSASVATVSTSGVVTAKAPGTATITASSEGKSGKSTITVKLVPVASIDMSPGELKLQIGQSGTITATPKAADGTSLSGRSISWKSRDQGIATVNSSGKVTAKASGSTIVEATSEGVTGVALVTVADIPVSSVTVSPDSATLTVGQSKQLDAKTYDAGGAELSGRSIAWSSSNEDVASVSSTGKVLAVAAGTATITATSEGKSDNATIRVVASVGSVTIQPDSISVIKGETGTLTATVKDADGNTLDGRSVTWKSNNTGVATVNEDGVVTAVSVGATTVTATSEGKSGQAKVVVTDVPVSSVTVQPDSISIIVGKTGTLSATLKDADGKTLNGRDVAWASGNSGVATVDGDGVVTGVSAGATTVTASSEGKSAQAKVVVTLAPVASVTVVDPQNPGTAPSVIQGQTLQLGAITKDADGGVLLGREVTWASANQSIATVNDNGVVTGITPGKTKITATSEGVDGSADVTVVSVLVEGSVIIVPADTTLIVSQSADLKGLVVNKDGNAKEDKDLTWSSDNSLVAAVNDHGRVQALIPGSATITAAKTTKAGDVKGTPGTAKVTVVAPGS